MPWIDRNGDVNAKMIYSSKLGKKISSQRGKMEWW